MIACAHQLLAVVHPLAAIGIIVIVTWLHSELCSQLRGLPGSRVSHAVIQRLVFSCLAVDTVSRLQYLVVVDVQYHDTV